MTPREVSRLVDVAARAQVTVSTASRALARPEMVRPETRARVEAAALDLGYIPNRVARSLITGTSATIAIVVPQLANAYFAEICRAGQVAARDRGYATFIVDSGNSRQQERETMRRLIGSGIDGIIICAAFTSYAPSDTPVVFVNRRARGSHAVLLDQVQIATTQVEHLRFLGHRHITWIAGPKRYWAGQLRRRHVERMSIRFPVAIMEGIPPTFEGGQEIVKLLDPSTTAVAAFNDSQAVGILSAAADVGLRIPEDLSVVGSDGTRLGAMVTPALTSVQAPLERLAQSAVSLLLDHLRDERGATIVETLPVELVVRSSTAPLPLAARPPNPPALSRERGRMTPADTSPWSGWAPGAPLLDGKVALVAGGGRGIGEATSRILAAAGATVAVMDNERDRAEAVAASIEATGSRAFPLVADLRDEVACTDAVARVDEELSGIDVLANVAGGINQYAKWQHLRHWTTDEWDAVVHLNLRYVFWLCRAVIPIMEARGGGAIVSVTSISGVYGAPNHSAYGAAKAGLIHLTKTLAAECGRSGIRVNAVSPGAVVTPATASTMSEARRTTLSETTPLQRPGAPEDIARGILFLASPMAAYVTGQMLLVDGGVSAKFPLGGVGTHRSEASLPTESA